MFKTEYINNINHMFAYVLGIEPSSAILGKLMHYEYFKCIARMPR